MIRYIPTKVAYLVLLNYVLYHLSFLIFVLNNNIQEKQLTILRQQLYDAQLNEPMARSSSLASTDRFRPGTPSTVTSIPVSFT